MNAIAVGATVAVFVWVFFRVIEMSFPETYFRHESVTDPIVNRSLVRYVLWRLGPVFVGAVATAVTVDRIRGSAALGLSVFYAVHVLTTVGRAIAVAVRRHRRLPLTLAFLYVLIVIGSGVSTLAGYLSRGALSAAIPAPRDLLQAVWLAAVASLLGLFLSKALGGTRPTAELVRRSLREIPAELLAEADRVSNACGADPRVARAVLIVENLQRPAWVRKVESSPMGRWFGARTTGIMQVTSPSRLSDAESIELGIGRFLSGLQVPGSDHDGEIFRSGYTAADALTDYNEGSAWQDLVSSVLAELLPNEGVRRVVRGPGGSTAMAPDAQPVIDATTLTLSDDGHSVRIEGSFFTRSQAKLAAWMVTGDGSPLPTTTTVETSGARTSFDISLSVADGVAIVMTTDESGAFSPAPFARLVVPRAWRRGASAHPNAAHIVRT